MAYSGNEKEYERFCKILLLGESGTGKTSILFRYVYNSFPSKYRATNGIDLDNKKSLQLYKNTKIQLQIWDAAGQERFRSLNRLFYGKVDGAFLVFDITQLSTLEDVKSWKSDLDSEVILSNRQPIPSVLLANKCDKLDTHSFSDIRNQLDDHCKRHGFLGWFETSAKANIGIDEAVKCLVTKILENDENYIEHMQKQALHVAMSEGGGKLLQSNIVLHGPPGAGKTSLKRIMVGLPRLPRNERRSTKIMENSVRAISTDRVKQFEIIENNDLIGMLASVVRKHEKEIEPNVSPVPHRQPGHHMVSPFKDEEDSSQHSSQSSPGNSSLKMSYSPVSFEEDESRDSPAEGIPHQSFQPSSSDSSPTMSPFSSFEEDESSASQIQVSTSTAVMLSIIGSLKHAKASFELFNSHWYHVVDSGGQPQFLDIFPLVYRSPSLSIVVIRLTDELDTKLQVCYYESSKNIYSLPDRLLLTNREFIVRMCQIATSCAESGGSIPYVMIVGTHKDKLGFLGFGATAKVNTINESLKGIRKEFGHVLICKSEEETIFDINTMATGRKRQMYTEELQRCISEALKKSAKPQYIPLRWLALQLDLDRDEGVVRMPECIESGKALGMEETDVETALVYFNKASLLLYFPEDIPNLVLTKVDPLIDRLSKLVKASFICPKPTLHSQSKKLRDKGIFDKSFLSELLCETNPGKLHNDEFLKLLERLKVVVHVEGDDYFLPSALSFDPPIESYEMQMSSVSLVFSWGERILPHGFFFTVAVEFLSSNDSSYSFKLRTDIPQWRDEVQVSERDGKIPGVVKLSNRVRWIQVSSSSSPRHCPTIKEAVNVAVQKACKRFEPHMRVGPPVVTCVCSLCKDKYPHPVRLTPDKKEFTCTVDESKTGVVTEDMSCWFEGSTYTTKTVQSQVEDISLPLIIPPVDDTTLSATNESVVRVLEATVTVTDWFNLGLKLNLAFHDLERIKLDNARQIDCQREMILLWLNTGKASWCCLVQALMSPLIDKEELAMRLAKLHIKPK